MGLNKLIIIGSLAAVFLATLVFSQKSLDQNLQLQQANIGQVAVTSKSPSDKVTLKVTPKNEVTPLAVTLSPGLLSNSPAPLEKQIVTTTINPQVSLMVTPTVTPALIPIQVTPTPTPFPSPTSSLVSPQTETVISSLVINEVAWMGTTADANDEWIELFNPSNQAVNLKGWVLKTLDGSPSVTLNGQVGPKSYFVLKRTSDVIPDVVTGQIYTGALENSGETLELRDEKGSLVDATPNSTAWAAGNNTNKATMERVNPAVSGTLAANWKTNNQQTRNGHDVKGNLINGTPGMANSALSF